MLNIVLQIGLQIVLPGVCQELGLRLREIQLRMMKGLRKRMQPWLLWPKETLTQMMSLSTT